MRPAKQQRTTKRRYPTALSPLEKRLTRIALAACAPPRSPVSEVSQREVELAGLWEHLAVAHAVLRTAPEARRTGA